VRFAVSKDIPYYDQLEGTWGFLYFSFSQLKATAIGFRVVGD
jgi:hypothetical protein